MFFVQSKHEKSQRKIFYEFDLISRVGLKRTHLLHKKKTDFGFSHVFFLEHPVWKNSQ